MTFKSKDLTRRGSTKGTSRIPGIGERQQKRPDLMVSPKVSLNWFY